MSSILSPRTLVVYCIALVINSLVFRNITYLFAKTCPATADGRVCNDHGFCTDQQTCLCDILFSGTACTATRVAGYSMKSNTNCNLRGNATFSVTNMFPECVEKIRAGVVTGGWDAPACIERVELAQNRLYITQTATPQDVLGIPICLCRPPWGGKDCLEYMPPRRLDGVVCSNAGNKTVGFIINGTNDGLGAQCITSLSLPEIVPHLTYAQALMVNRDIDTFVDGLCARLYTTESGITLVIPDVAYFCACDDKHFGETCEFGACSGDPFCSGHGAPGNGFGAESNTTRNVSRYGVPGVPHCVVGSEGCCFGDQAICELKEPKCPDDFPLRCSSTSRCVALPKVDRCGLGWQYGYLDDPNQASRRAIVAADTLLDSPVVWFEFRIRGATHFDFTYDGVIHHWPGTSEFWKGPIKRTTEEVERDAFVDSHEVSVEIDDSGFIHAWPAPFRSGETLPTMLRLRSLHGSFAVIDVVGAVVRLDEGTDLLLNVTDDAYLRPGGSQVSASDCFSDLAACVWTPDFLGLDGTSRLCQLDGVAVSVSSRFACATPTRAMRRVVTAVYGKSRVVGPDWTDSWTYQEFVGPVRRRLLTIDGDGDWTAGVVTVNDLRVPCACSQPVTPEVNESLWNRIWIDEFNRPEIKVPGARAVALVQSYGDARIVRGVLGGNGLVTTPNREIFRVTRAKRLSKPEYTKGRPNPNDFVFPARCPGGGAADIVVVDRLNANTTTTCVVEKNTATCDNGCVCELNGLCVCLNEPESEAPLAVFLKEHVSGDCFITRSNRVVTVQTFATVNSTSCFKADGFSTPLEFRSSVCGSATLQARFYKGAWTDLEIITSCVSVNDTEHLAIRPIVDDAARAFDEWCVFVPGIVSATFSPFGISLFRTNEYALTASENQEDAGNVVWNDASWWSSGGAGWLRVDFDEPVRLVGMLIEFRTVGLYVSREFGALNVSVTLQTGTRTSRNESTRVDWEFIDYFWSDVVNGSVMLYLPLDITATTTFRVLSRFPMSVRRLVPLTDQRCAIGLLLPGTTLPEDSMREYIVRNYTEADAVCTCDDSCFLVGQSAANDGVCSDYKHLSFGQPTRNVAKIEIDFGLDEIMTKLYPPNTTSNGTASFVCQTNGCCAWGYVFPKTPFSCNDTMSYDAAGFLYGYTETPDSGHYTVSYVRRVVGDSLSEGDNTCRNGTDCTDCGRSSRTSSLESGVSCPIGEVEARLMNRTKADHEFAATAPIAEILRGGTRLIFTAIYARTIRTMGRGPCGDCDGRVRCSSGVCSDSIEECPVTYYTLLGDGCTQTDSSRRTFACACGLGWGGYACDKDVAESLDVSTGAGDPNAKATCGGKYARKFPKLRAKPPFPARMKKGWFSDAEIVRMNRLEPRKSDMDVGWVNIRTTEQPFGPGIFRWFVRGGKRYFTNCGYYFEVNGQLYDLEESVIRDPITKLVVQWKEFDIGNGVKAVFPWNGPKKEATYDAVPFRCSSGTTCVADLSECDTMDAVNKPCGGHGTCLADSSCKCDSGWTTFVLSEHVSKAVAVPYYSVDGVPKPTAWGKPDPVFFDSATCQAIDCVLGDCSPPHGCFTGTPALAFADKHIVCPTSSGHGGRCAIDVHACARNEVMNQVVCSGNGILVKSDYREEWYCICGTSKGGSEARESSELVPNGYGGRACDHYYSGEDMTKVWIQRTDPITNKPYVGADGIELPFKWRVVGGTPVGPKPEDLALWQQCCPGIKRLERCDKVPCGRGVGINKIFTCESASRCLGYQTTPAVAVCNGHGRARGDGSCECDTFDGGGYTHDYETFSYDGCFKRARCAVGANGETCNKPSNRGDFRMWSEIPKIAYWEQQWRVLLMRAGYAPTDQNFVSFVFKDDRDAGVRSAMGQIARTVIDDFNQASSTICIVANDDPTDPFGMVPYDPSKVCAHMDGYVSPFWENATTWVLFGMNAPAHRILTDGLFGTGSVLRNVDYVVLEGTIMVLYTELITLDAVRVHARRGANATVGTTTGIEFHGSDGAFVCDDLEIGSKVFEWVSLQCVPTYVPFDFRLVYPAEFATNCRPDESVLACRQWKDARCLSRGYVVNLPGDTMNTRVGCDDSRCCIPKRAAFGPTAYVAVTARLGDAIEIDELRLYVHYKSVRVTPVGLNNELVAREGPTSCRDGKFMAYMYGSALSYFKHREWKTTRGTELVIWPDPNTNHNWTTANEACEESGGVLASSRGFTTASAYASDMGDVCFNAHEPNESPMKDKAVVDVPCLVAARERSEKRLPNMTEIVESSCLSYGCWTPIHESYEDTPIDFLSTPQWDKDGNQWKAEWIPEMLVRRTGNDESPGYVMMSTALTSLRREAARQAWMTRVPQSWITGWDYSWDPEVDDHVRGMEIPYWQRLGDNPTCAADAWISLYQRRSFKGRPFQFTDPGQTERPVKVWSNPQVCEVTVYSDPMCGRILVDPYRVSSYGSAKKVYVVTPADDYKVLDYENVFEMKETYTAWYTECIDPLFRCSGQGSIIRNVKSISIQGPCGVVVNSTNSGAEYSYYIPEGGTKITDSHFQRTTRVGGCFVDPVGRWTDGCHSQFRQDDPLGGAPCACGACNGLACCCPAEIDVLPAQTETFTRNGIIYKGLAPNGFPGGTITSLRIIGRFSSRKLEIMHRTNPKASAKDENDFVLGYDRHPYMVSNVRVLETKRVYAGMKKPTFDRVDHSPRNVDGEFTPVRVKVQKNGFSVKTYTPPEDTTIHFTNIFNDQSSTLTYATAGAGTEMIYDIASFIPMENQLEPYVFTWQDMRAGKTFYDSTLIMPYVTSESLGRPVLRCRNCLKPQPSNWEWDQRFFNTEKGTFEVSVTTMSNTGLGSKQVRPLLHASWTTHRDEGVVSAYVDVSEIEFTKADVYARIIAGLRLIDYRRPIETVNETVPGFYFDWCVVVDRDAATEGYLFRPAVCESKRYKALCVRDIRKYTVQDGCQCDACGASSRSTAYDSSTAFTLYPRARRAGHELEHDIKDAYLTGDFNAFLNQNPIPSSAIATYVRSLPQAFISSMPGFFELFVAQISTRANHLSPGQVADYQLPVDFAFADSFPHDCGRVTSISTGQTQAVVAHSSNQCSRDAFNETIMPQADLPRAFEAVSFEIDAATEPRCGRWISPTALVASTPDEGPAPNTNDFRIVESHEEYVVIQVLNATGTFRNSRRDLDRFRNQSIFTGSVSCSVAKCSIELLVTSLEPNYLNPVYSLVLGLTDHASPKDSYRLSLVSNATYWRTLAWRWRDLPVGSTLHISRVLVSDPYTVTECRAPIEVTWADVPPRADSPAPQHTCRLTGDDAGLCDCSESSPYGGPTCDDPATVGKGTKLICGTPEGVHPPKSRTIAPDGSLVYVNENGVFHWRDVAGRVRSGCKTRADYGSQIKARMIDGSMLDFRYVVRGVDAPNLKTFIEPTAEDFARMKIEHPLDDEVAALCKAKSSRLPSFQSGNEISDYVKEGVSHVLLDLRVRDGDLVWSQRAETLLMCSSNATCNVRAVYAATPCEVGGSVEACRATQFTNTLFNMTGNHLTDGRNSSANWTTASISIPTNRLVSWGLSVMVLTNSTSGLSVKAACPTCGIGGRTCTVVVSDARRFECGFRDSGNGQVLKLDDISEITISRVGGMYVSEVGAFWVLDSWRPYPFL